MLTLVDDKINFDCTKCQQCGVCKSICPKESISLSLLHNGLHEITVDRDKCIRCGKCVSICPANRKGVSEDYFDNLYSKKYYFAYNANNEIRMKSSSGGVCKTLIIEGLRNGLVDGVYSLKKKEIYPYAEGEFYTKYNIPDYEDIPNSVYHSVMLGDNIQKIVKCNRLMIIGTSCQLRALEKVLKNKCNELIKICIFCKQQKSIESTRFLAKIMGTIVPENLIFKAQYRGIGWPGLVQINNKVLSWHRAAQVPFGRRLWTVPGCNVCGDPFGIEVNSDLSLMDPWKIRQENALGETLVVVNTLAGLNLLEHTPHLVLEEKSYKEIEVSLDLRDIERKRQLVPFFRGEYCSFKIKFAGGMERLQRSYLQSMVAILPRLPLLGYRIICKIPDIRNIILK